MQGLKTLLGMEAAIEGGAPVWNVVGPRADVILTRTKNVPLYCHGRRGH